MIGGPQGPQGEPAVLDPLHNMVRRELDAYRSEIFGIRSAGVGPGPQGVQGPQGHQGVGATMQGEILHRLDRIEARLAAVERQMEERG